MPEPPQACTNMPWMTTVKSGERRCVRRLRQLAFSLECEAQDIHGRETECRDGISARLVIGGACERPLQAQYWASAAVRGRAWRLRTLTRRLRDRCSPRGLRII